MLRNLFFRSAAGPRATLRAGAARLAMLASVAGFAALAAATPAAAQGAQPAGAAATAVAPRPVDRIVAVVNSEAITASELALRMKVAERQLRAQNIEAPPTDVLEKQVLERMIVDRAQLQAARDAGIRVDNA
ncbi:MAG: SurA N-terminal domain-containing protein, partial [Burkholderiaceae bacterium]|nr:SurA N-terminal domain-containing protein [Burkholderiaceae bacterium]